MKETENPLQGFILKEFSSKESLSDKLVIETAELYAKVFAGSPWFEVNKCGTCESFFGPETTKGQECKKCNNGILAEAYPIAETSKTISEIFDKESPSMFLAFDNDKLVGFTWGYLKDSEEYYKKFGDYSKDAEDILRLAFTNKKQFYFLSEIGIDPAMRGKGLGKELLRKLAESGSRNNVFSTAWTRCDAVIAPILLKAGFKQVFGPEVVIKDRQIFLTGKIIGGTDPNTKERVLFIK